MLEHQKFVRYQSGTQQRFQGILTSLGQILSGPQSLQCFQRLALFLIPHTSPSPFPCPSHNSPTFHSTTLFPSPTHLSLLPLSTLLSAPKAAFSLFAWANRSELDRFPHLQRDRVKTHPYLNVLPFQLSNPVGTPLVLPSPFVSDKMAQRKNCHGQ